MRGLTLGHSLARLLRALRLLLVEIRYGLADRELQLLNHHAQRMAAERAEICERRARLALELLRLEAFDAHP